MLVIVSDLHLGDGTTASSIAPSAFHLFANRLSETAYFASFRTDGKYRPLKSMDLVLMGDILDPIHSTRWLDTSPGAENFVRPWTDVAGQYYAPKLAETTQSIIDVNREAVDVLKRLSNGQMILLPPADSRGRPDRHSRERIPLKLNIHYLVGNHDWYYHLKGPAFDEIRKTIIDSMGLSNPVNLFPHEIDESPRLQEVMETYKVFGRHGDTFDKFNFNQEQGRDHATLGDIFCMSVCNRYPVEVERQYGEELPKGIIDSLRRLTNIRPALATPLWISGQIKRHAGNPALEVELKEVWDDLCDEFLQLDVVREEDRAFHFDMVDALQLAIKISKRTSFSTINDIVMWVRNKLWESEHSFAEHALREPAFLKNTAKYIVYGHTHHHEIIALDSDGDMGSPENQLYINSGTWHSYFDLAVKDPSEQKFIPYQTLTYLTFYKGDEREGRHFEAWSGAYA